jgi:hypothetical protein
MNETHVMKMTMKDIVMEIKSITSKKVNGKNKILIKKRIMDMLLELE